MRGGSRGRPGIRGGRRGWCCRRCGGSGGRRERGRRASCQTCAQAVVSHRERMHISALSPLPSIAQLVTVARHSRFVRSVSTLVSASTLGPTLCVVTSALFTCRFPTAASRPIALGGHGDGDPRPSRAACPRVGLWRRILKDKVPVQAPPRPGVFLPVRCSTRECLFTGEVRHIDAKRLFDRPRALSL